MWKVKGPTTPMDHLWTTSRSLTDHADANDTNSLSFFTFAALLVNSHLLCIGFSLAFALGLLTLLEYYGSDRRQVNRAYKSLIYTDFLRVILVNFG